MCPLGTYDFLVLKRMLGLPSSESASLTPDASYEEGRVKALSHARYAAHWGKILALQQSANALVYEISLPFVKL